MSLSIIFPAYEEGRKISADIISADLFLRDNNINGEIIVVDDGSKDDTYQKSVDLSKKIESQLTVMQHERNLGKGAAVRTGILKATNEILLYSDVGSIVPLDNALEAITEIKLGKAEIMHASRKDPNSEIIKEQDSDRKISSWIFNKISRVLFNLPPHLTDTQCGFKLYKREIARELFENLMTNGFLFELEVIIKASNAKFRIVEFPVTWKCDRDSRINYWSTPKEVISEMYNLYTTLK